jgi:hypothetical protein
MHLLLLLKKKGKKKASLIFWTVLLKVFKIGFQRVGLFGVSLLFWWLLVGQISTDPPKASMPVTIFAFTHQFTYFLARSHLNDLFSFVLHLSCSVFNPVSCLFSVVLAGDWLPRKRRAVRWPFVVSFFPSFLFNYHCYYALGSWHLGSAFPFTGVLILPCCKVQHMPSLSNEDFSHCTCSDFLIMSFLFFLLRCLYLQLLISSVKCRCI